MMSDMTRAQFMEICRHLRSCEDYLNGKQTSKYVQEVADHGAKLAVLECIKNFEERLRDCGLNIREEV